MSAKTIYLVLRSCCQAAAVLVLASLNGSFGAGSFKNRRNLVLVRFVEDAAEIERNSD